MIRHCVFINFKDSISEDKKDKLFKEILDLKDRLTGIEHIYIGANVSPEVGMDKSFSDGFIVDFDNANSRDAYLEDSEHQKTGARLVDSAKGGVEGILVYDLET